MQKKASMKRQMQPLKMAANVIVRMSVWFLATLPKTNAMIAVMMLTCYKD